jgi:hypothetical protein
MKNDERHLSESIVLLCRASWEIETFAPATSNKMIYIHRREARTSFDWVHCFVILGSKYE